LPNNIIKRSRAFAGTQTNRLEDLIIELESLSQEYQRKSSLLEAEKIHADDLMKSYEEKINALAKDVRLMKQRAVEEASNILASANARIEQAIKEIKESQADKKAIKDARNTIDTLKKDIREVQRGIDSASSTELGETFSIGDRVTMNGSSECGEVVSSIDSIGEVLVAFKNMKMRVSVRDLVKFEERYAPEVSSFISNRDAFGKIPVSREIDLRGKLGDEAIALVEKFLEDAYVAGLQRVDIIHGKGTGALRRKVSEYLKEHPYVRLFRLGNWNEGGAGVTVVELQN
jgi:DNA mismatch repair protein MutS2